MSNNKKNKASTIDVLRFTLEQLREKFASIQFSKWFKIDPLWRYRFIQYGLLMRLDKPIGTLLLLWPTLWALWLASDGLPSMAHILIFSCGVFLMRSAGCVINDYADREIDGDVARTKNRPLAKRTITEKEALIVFIVLALCAFSLVLLLNTLAMYLSFGAIIIATVYPFMKRYTYFPQIVLGMAFSMSIPMAFAAVQDEIPTTAWLLYITNLMWVLAYDTLYAMVDKKDDLKIGVKSTAIFFGEADLQITAIIQGMFIFGMLLVGSKFELSYPYYLSLAIASGLIIRQIYNARKHQPDKCFESFINNNWVGLIIFCGILLSKPLIIN
ncbi:MAG: 4-hydroxybenzoate octaprenyltransferase [Kangiella sp.]|nr:MAG: 4-hydroxybenzoate octaprenyltransferase [Kangiella sp.]